MQEIENTEEVWSLEPFMAALLEWSEQKASIDKSRRRRRGSIFIQFTQGTKVRNLLFSHFNDYAPIKGKSLVKKLASQQQYHRKDVHFHIFFAREFDESVRDILLKKKKWQKSIALFEVTNPNDSLKTCILRHNQRQRLRPLNLFLKDFLPQYRYQISIEEFDLFPPLKKPEEESDIGIGKTEEHDDSKPVFGTSSTPATYPRAHC